MTDSIYNQSIQFHNQLSSRAEIIRKAQALIDEIDQLLDETRTGSKQQLVQESAQQPLQRYRHGSRDAFFKEDLDGYRQIYLRKKQIKTILKSLSRGDSSECNKSLSEDCTLKQ